MSSILSAIGTVITAVIGWVKDSLVATSEIFYDTSGTTPAFTFIGTLSLVAFGLGMVWVAVKFIKSLCRRG